MTRRGAIAALIVLTATAPLAWSEAPLPRRGSSMAEVREQMGRPERVARVILFRRHVEQWHFAGGSVVEFDCVRGEDPSVTRSHLGSR